VNAPRRHRLGRGALHERLFTLAGVARHREVQVPVRAGGEVGGTTQLDAAAESVQHDAPLEGPAHVHVARGSELRDHRRIQGRSQHIAPARRRRLDHDGTEPPSDRERHPPCRPARDHRPASIDVLCVVMLVIRTPGHVRAAHPVGDQIEDREVPRHRVRGNLDSVRGPAGGQRSPGGHALEEDLAVAQALVIPCEKEAAQAVGCDVNLEPRARQRAHGSAQRWPGGIHDAVVQHVLRVDAPRRARVAGIEPRHEGAPLAIANHDRGDRLPWRGAHRHARRRPLSGGRRSDERAQGENPKVHRQRTQLSTSDVRESPPRVESAGRPESLRDFGSDDAPATEAGSTVFSVGPYAPFPSRIRRTSSLVDSPSRSAIVVTRPPRASTTSRPTMSAGA